MGNPRRFFEHIAAFGGFGRYHFGNFALPDDRVPVAPKPRIHKQFVDVAQAGVFAVDDVFALTRTVIAARNRHFIRIFRQRAVFVVKTQGDLGIAFGFAQVRTHKDNIFHFRAAQIFGGLLAQYPAHRVGNVAFAAAVRPDNCGYALIEFQHGFVRKGLKPLHFQRL